MNSAEKWQEVSSVCGSSFRRMFISEDKKYIYDHLNEDGTPDTQMRPNQIFTSSLLDDNILVLRPRLPSSLSRFAQL